MVCFAVTAHVKGWAKKKRLPEFLSSSFAHLSLQPTQHLPLTPTNRNNRFSLEFFTSLTTRQGNRRSRLGQNPQAGRSMHWPPRLFDLSFIRRRHWLRLHFPSDGATISWLWQEVQVGVCHLPSSTDFNRCCRALQLSFDHPHHAGTFRLRIHGR